MIYGSNSVKLFSKKEKSDKQPENTLILA